MKTHLSAPIIRLASATPGLARPALHMAGRMFSRRKPHWLVREIASELGCRVPVDVRLGNGMKIRVVWTDAVGSEICTRGYYELPTVRLFEQTLKPGMVFIDAGAHVGQYTLLAAGLGATVHSFEPDPETFRLLQHNVATNELENVQLNQCALGERSEVMTLYMGQPDNVGSSSLRQRNHSRVSCVVECQTLDSYLERSGIARVDLLKIDVEGAEFFVLRGARRLLSGESRPYVIVEFCQLTQEPFGYGSLELAKLLESLGYRLFRITENGPAPYETRREELFFNVLGIPG